MESYLHDPEIVDDFTAEVTEHLDAAADLAIAAEQGDTEALTDLRRVVHTIKGAAGFVGLDAFSEICHELEEVLLRQLSSPSPEACSSCFDHVHAVCDLLREWLDEVERACRERDAFRDEGRGAELIAQLRQERAA